MKLDIKTLERYSGIKAHTIRAWEQRFKLFKPLRSAGNRRSYGAQELQTLLNFSILNRYGTSISKLLQYSADDITHKINHLKTTGARKDIVLNQLVIDYVGSNIGSFEHQLSEYSAEFGAHKCAVDLLVPFIECVGLFYYIDQRPATHFVVTAIRKKLHQASENLKVVSPPAFTALLFLPANQHFDLLLLYISYQLQHSGVRVLYLGTNVGSDIINTVVAQYAPEVLVSYLVPGKNMEDLSRLTTIASGHKNLFVGTPTCEINSSGNKLQTVYYRNIATHLNSWFIHTY